MLPRGLQRSVTTRLPRDTGILASDSLKPQGQAGDPPHALLATSKESVGNSSVDRDQAGSVVPRRAVASALPLPSARAASAHAVMTARMSSMGDLVGTSEALSGRDEPGVAPRRFTSARVAPLPITAPSCGAPADEAGPMQRVPSRFRKERDGFSLSGTPRTPRKAEATATRVKAVTRAATAAVNAAASCLKSSVLVVVAGRLLGRLCSQCQAVSRSALFERAIIFAIVLNTVSLGIEHHGMSDELVQLVANLEVIFAVIFLLGKNVRWYCSVRFIGP